MTFGKRLIGETLANRYRLVRWIGGGGFADVFEAEDLNFDRDRVAVKVLKPEFAKRVAVEARIARKFKHPNVVSVNDMSNVEAEIPFIVMEYLDGRTLDQLLPLSVPLFRQFVLEICGALQHAHAQGLVHRDLKLQNIMLVNPGTSSQQFKILDFGIATQTNAEMTLRNATMDGGGTIEYMPPEYLIATGIKPTPKSDIYSFGVILYELLLGRRPFQADGRKLMATMQVIESVLAPRFREIDPDCQIDSAVESLVLQCLSKSPESRPATIREVAERFLASYGVDEQQSNQDTKKEFRVVRDSDPLPLPLPNPTPQAPEFTPQLAPRQAATDNQTRLPQEPTVAPSVSSRAESSPHNTQRPEAGGNRGGSAGTMLPDQQSNRTISPGNLTVRTQRPTPERLDHDYNHDHDHNHDQRAATEQPDRPFAWVRNSVIVVVALLLLVTSTLALLQRQFAIRAIEQLVEQKQFADAVRDLDSGSFFSHPFLDREKYIRNVHDRWLEETQGLAKSGEAKKVIDECRAIQESFPQEPRTAEMLQELVDQTRKKIRDSVEADRYPEALGWFTGESVGARLARLSRKLLDPDQVKADILNTGLAKCTTLLAEKKYAAVITVGGHLQTAFLTNQELKDLLARASICQWLESGNQNLEGGKYPEAVSDYSQVLELNPKSDQRREALFKRASAWHAIAARLIDQLKETELTAETAEPFVKPVNLTFADLNELLTPDTGDQESRSLRARTFLLRARLWQRQKNLSQTLDDINLAMAAAPALPEIPKLLLELFEEEDRLSRMHYDIAEKLSSGTDQEWQDTIEHLSNSIQIYNVLQRVSDFKVEARYQLPYFFRGKARYQRMKRDYQGALEDLETFKKSSTTESDGQLKIKLIDALTLEAWIKATCPDPGVQKSKEAKQAATEANTLFESLNGPRVKWGQPQIETWSHIQKARAVAEAADGDFNRASEITEVALEQTRSRLGADSDDYRFHRKLLAMWEKMEPYIEPPAGGSNSGSAHQ